MSIPSIYDLAEGLWPDVPATVYHQRVLGLASKGALDRVSQSPAHYLAWVNGADEEEPSSALAFGTAFHAAMLEPERWETQFVVQPDFGDCRFKDAKANRDAWRKEHEGAIIIEPAEMAAIRGMREAIHRHPLASEMLRDGSPELTLKWTDEETGLVCKARADFHLPRVGLCVDIKTTEDASEGAFRRTVQRWGYHRQAAFYSDGFRACGAPLRAFAFLVIERRPPYAIGLYSLDLASEGNGRGTIRRDLDTLADCIERDDWPGYDESIRTIALPDWA